MARKPKKPGQQNSKVFSIVISVVVVAMIGIIVVTVAGNKKPEGAKGKIETSPVATATASVVGETTGAAKLAALSDNGDDSEIGKIVPTIKAQNFNGEDVTITPGTKPYVLAFVAHWCGFCQAEVPAIVKLEKAGKLPKGVEFIAVATGTTTARTNYPPSKWLSKEEWPWRTIADDQEGNLLDGFGGSGFPYLVYVNADGTVQARTSGKQTDETIIANAKAIAQSSK